MRSAIAYYVVLMLVIVAGCGKTEIASNSDNDPAEVEQPAAEETTADPPAATPETGLTAHADYPVPDLAPPQLLDYINQVATLKPYGDTDEEYIADQINRSKSRLIAADRIILDASTDENLMVAAVQAKLDTLKSLAILDPNGLGTNFLEFIDALNKGNSPEFARMGRVSRFWLEVDRLAYGQTDAPDDLMTELEKLLSDKDAGEAEFLAAQDGGFILNERGFANDATNVLKQIGDRFKDHKDVGDEARDLIEKTAFREKVIGAMGGDKKAVRTLFLAIRDLLIDKENLNVETLDNTLNAGQVLEFNGHLEEAGKVFDAIKKAYRGHKDEQLSKQAELSVQFAQKRLGVIGKQIDIEGIHIDGKPFNWKKYDGKVVLVDFWASTSAPWLNDLPNLKSNYDRFHDEGFEIVGINVDYNRDNAYDYLQNARLPWPTIIDEISPGLDANPNAIRYGIQAVPFVMLVGRDGKVVDIHVRGPQLSDRIQNLLDMPTSKNARKTDNDSRS